MSIIPLIRSAWDSTKKSHQPAFNDLIQSYQNMLQARAEAAIADGVSNDVKFQVFEREAVSKAISDSFSFSLHIVPVTIEDGVVTVPAMEILSTRETEVVGADQGASFVLPADGDVISVGELAGSKESPERHNMHVFGDGDGSRSGRKFADDEQPYNHDAVVEAMEAASQPKKVTKKAEQKPSKSTKKGAKKR